MQLDHANSLVRIKAAADHDGCQVATPVNLDRWNFSTSDRDEVLALLRQSDRSKPIFRLVLIALASGFGLGWAGAWYGPATISAFNSIPEVETASRRMPDAKRGAKVESARKIASASGWRTPPALGQPSTVSASLAPKTLAKASGAAQSAEASNASSVIDADMSVTGSLASAGPLLPVPDTRPATIEGWAVLDVRGGTAVLEGPAGVRMAARGDVVAGIGRIDSIVRWGNRWIVATARGLISTP
ncbi:hypothetical protein XH89_14445 [Bradyrhizobium sp. CCBAU 53340]|nr:hypothetical protein XH89_14445 [Bradyrhizobium sp. CCBAU 53340]